MAELLLGPVLRAGPTGETSVWVETTAPCVVSVLGNRAPTFTVRGHHYALVTCSDLPAGETLEYDVEIDGDRVWPDPALGLPPSRFETWGPHTPFRVVGGSCRQQAPMARDPHRRASEQIDDLGPDALAALGAAIQNGGRPTPHLLLLTGDQVYADEQHESVRNALRTRRGGPPADDWPEVASFEEYSWLYQRTWAHPRIRWLLSCVPSLMIFDDHDVIDDWNISESWTRDMADVPWWPHRLRAAIMAYWVYQHIGNMSAAERAGDPLWRAVTEADDGGDLLADFADSVGTGTTARLETSWSFHRELGPVSLLVLDARNARVLDPAERSVLSDRDWELAERTVDGAARRHRHLLVVSSVPWIMPSGIHRLERWVSRLADEGRGPVRWLAERLRRAIDLEHWPAFGTSFERLAALLGSEREIRTSRAGGTPDTASRGHVTAGGAATRLVFSGDVHFAYVARMDPSGAATAVHQLVSSPLRQTNPPHEHLAMRLAMSRAFDMALRGLLRLTRGDHVATPFRITHGPFFDNNVAAITYEADRVRITLERAALDPRGGPVLHPLATHAIQPSR